MLYSRTTPWNASSARRTRSGDDASTSARSASSGSATTAATRAFGRVFCSKRCSDQFFFGDDDDVELTRRRRAWPSPLSGPGACGAPSACGRWCARPASPPSSSIYPLFVAPGEGVRREIPSLPGLLPPLGRRGRPRGPRGRVPRASAGVILFGLPEGKDPLGSEGYAEDGVVQQASPRDPRRVPRPPRDDRRLPLRVHLARPLRRGRGRRGAERPDPRPARADGGLPRPRRRPRGGAFRHDGRPGRARSAAPSTAPASPTPPSCPTPPSTPRPSTARSARRPTRPRSSATGGATRWTPPTSARPCARCGSTSRRARTCVMVKPALALPRRDPRGARGVRPARWPPTTSPASTRW